MGTNLVSAQWTIAEIEDLYVNRNYSMELVSRITRIPIASLSRILWNYGLPDKKRERYGPDFAGELRRAPEYEKLNVNSIPKEDDIINSFFSGL